MISLLKILPVVIGMIIGGAGTLFIGKMIKPEIKLDCPRVPDCNCPPAVQALDVDKLKNFKGTLKIEQNYQVEMDGDSLFFVKMGSELSKLKVVRCR